MGPRPFVVSGNRQPSGASQGGGIQRKRAFGRTVNLDGVPMDGSAAAVQHRLDKQEQFRYYDLILATDLNAWRWSQP